MSAHRTHEAQPLRSLEPARREARARKSLRLCVGLSLLALLPTLAGAQANYTENFNNLGTFTVGQDGPSGLAQLGWTFKAQSGWQNSGSPTYDWVWREGPYYQTLCGFNTFAAHEGSGYLATDGNSAWILQGQLISYDWAILPDIPGLSAGDVVTFWARRELDLGVQRLEVRFSPTGSTSTGSAPSDVGDFTDELLAITSPSANSWGQFSAIVPGSGRLAFRYVLDPLSSACHQVIGIDQLSIGAPLGPCSGYPQIPAAGQTVTWQTTGSPYHICTQTDIPLGATVIVESGSVVFVDPNSTLEVHGHLEVQGGARIDTPFGGSLLVHGSADFSGTAAQPVILTGGPRGTFGAAPERIAAMPGALVNVMHADLTTTIAALGDGVVVAEHVNASGARNGFYVCGPTGFYGGNLAVRSSTFVGDAEIYALGGYVLIDDIVFDDSKLEMRRPWAGQTMAIDNVLAVNRPNDTTFHLGGADFYFGSGNVISGTQYPVRLEGGGLARGSVLPTTGNAVDRVLTLASAEGRTHFPKLAIPYEVEAAPVPLAPIGGQIVVDPGATILMRPGASLNAVGGSYYGTSLVLKGLPDDPILVDRANPALPWQSVSFNADHEFRPRVEHTIFRGSESGLSAKLTWLRAESCLFENNDVGTDAFTEARIEVHGSRWFGNGIGARSSSEVNTSGHLDLDADSYPNWFEGNGIGLWTRNTALLYDDAVGNYWGDPSGPDDENNPSGLGDSTPGTNHVLPFLAAPPVANHAPVVRLLPHSQLFDEGSKVILHWEAFDDDAITGFQIYYSPHGNNPGLSLYVDSIPPRARSWEIVVPAAPPASNDPDLSGFRVQAIDTFGQIGYDELAVRIPQVNGATGGFRPDAPQSPQRPGQLLTVCGQWYGGANQGLGYETFLWFDGDDQLYPLAFGGPGNCQFFAQELPPFSTDLARIVTRHTWGGGGGRMIYDFSDYFEVRPPVELGDAPPVVSLTSPANGQLISGGDLVTLGWSASDDNALHGFAVHASYDGGRTWHTIATHLDATVTDFDWQLPPSSGISDCLVRVVAYDSRFQNSSATSEAFSILPGPSQVGTNFCTSSPNSVGAGALLRGVGSTVISQNAFGLAVDGLPHHQPGLFYYGSTAINLPFGGGVRCVDGQTVRLSPAVFSTSNGTASRGVDFGAAPMVNQFTPGSTWYFQYWYRDPAAIGSGFNLTDGLQVDWL